MGPQGRLLAKAEGQHTTACFFARVKAKFCGDREICVCIYMQLYLYTDAHTSTHTRRCPGLWLSQPVILAVSKSASEAESLILDHDTSSSLTCVLPGPNREGWAMTLPSLPIGGLQHIWCPAAGVPATVQFFYACALPALPRVEFVGVR